MNIRTCPRATLYLLHLIFTMFPVHPYGNTLESTNVRVDPLGENEITVCRRGEIVLVPVQNRLATLPCKTLNNLKDSTINLYVGTPKSNLVQLERNDSSIVNYTRKNGFVIRVSNLTSYTCSVGTPNLENENYVIFNLTSADNFLDITCDCDCNYAPGKFYTCRVASNSFLGKAKWFVRSFNGEYKDFPADATLYKNKSLQGEINLERRQVEFSHNNVSHIGCRATLQNYSTRINKEASVFVLLKNATKPEIINKSQNNLVEDKEKLNLTCLYKSKLNSWVTWKKDGLSWQPSVYNHTQMSTVKNFTITTTGPSTFTRTNYTCLVSNTAGSDSKTFTVFRKAISPGEIPVTNWRGILMYTSLPLMVTVLLAIPVASNMLRNHKRRERVRANLGDELVGIDFGKCGNRVGEGQYGEVYTTTMGEVPVAVKAFKWPPSLSEDEAMLLFLDFLEEIRVMKRLMTQDGSQYIVKYLGYCAPSVTYFKVYLVLEFCEPGQLQSYLRVHNAQRTVFDDIENNTFLYENQQEELDARHPTPILCTSDLLKWAEQIALGMRYVAKNQIIHRDLAARNILLQGISLDDMVALVGDFGMARILKNEAYISPREESNNPAHHKPRFIPVCWWPLESLHGKTGYSLKGDVWAFGVLLWEMFTLCGRKPYAEADQLPNENHCSHSFQLKLADYLSNPANRLCRPTEVTVPDRVWELMKSCWHQDPKERPDFEKIHATLKTVNEELGLYRSREVNEMQANHPTIPVNKLPPNYCQVAKPESVPTERKITWLTRLSTFTNWFRWNTQKR